MKKIILFAAAIALSGAATASAQIAASTSVDVNVEVNRGATSSSANPFRKAYDEREAVKKEVDAIREEQRNITQKAQEERRDLQAQVREMRQEDRGTSSRATSSNRDAAQEKRIKNVAENITRQLERILGNIENLRDRIASRISKLEERGIDTTTAKINLVLADQAIVEAGTDIAAVKASINAGISTREALEALREQTNEAKMSIRAAHAALVETVKSLKPGVNKDVTATSTTTTSASAPSTSATSTATTTVESN